MGWGELRQVGGPIQALLGCQWGRVVHTPDDAEDHDEAATGVKVHYDTGRGWSACGNRSSISTDVALVTCRPCKRRAEEDYASQRDGIDYRQPRWQDRRELAADRQRAMRIVVERHGDEFEMEFALLRLARMAPAR